MKKDTDTIIKLFKRFKKEELLEVLCECGLLKQASLATSGSKSSFINRVLRCCPVITARHVSLIDLMYHQAHPGCKKWNVYQLTTPAVDSFQGTSDPAKFEDRLRSELEVYFRIDMCLQVWNSAYWIRLCIINKPASRGWTTLSNSLFLVYSPLSKYFLATAMKVAHKEFILQSLTNAVGCHEIEEVSLSGRNVQSLTDLLLNSTSQGFFSCFRLRQIDSNPLTVTGKRKRQLEMKDFSAEPELVCGCEDGNDADDNTRRNFVADAFGCNQQPVLEKVEFKLETKFRGTNEGVQYNGPLHCRVKFEGPSVIEGIKQLACVGIADVPLPPYLANVNSLSRNHFLLTDKKRARTGDCIADTYQTEGADSPCH